MHEPRALADVHVLDHSVLAAKMSGLRDKTTATVQFRGRSLLENFCDS
jgi:uracil phosphoribosyltransferase